jgi:hypothetical protein
MIFMKSAIIFEVNAFSVGTQSELRDGLEGSGVRNGINGFSGLSYHELLQRGIK